MDATELVERFETFSDWEEKYAYLIDLGKKLPPMSPELKTETNRVQGCTSLVWMIAEKKGEVVHFVADSDSAIVRGLVAILMSLYSDRPASEIQALDMGTLFTRLGLDAHLSPNRRNGFVAMVDRIRKLAAPVSVLGLRPPPV